MIQGTEASKDLFKIILLNKESEEDEEESYSFSYKYYSFDVTETETTNIVKVFNSLGTCIKTFSNVILIA
jgi:hypothetical protein